MAHPELVRDTCPKKTISGPIARSDACEGYQSFKFEQKENPKLEIWNDEETAERFWEMHKFLHYYFLMILMDTNDPCKMLQKN